MRQPDQIQSTTFYTTEQLLYSDRALLANCANKLWFKPNPDSEMDRGNGPSHGYN